MPRLNILVAKSRDWRHRLQTKSEKSWILPAPLVIYKDLLKDVGITFKVYCDDTDALYDADCVLVESKVFRNWGKEAQDRNAYALLERLKERVERVVWFDSTDGTGTTQFQLLPYVDAYFKVRMLRDTSLYTTAYYGGRIFTDYFHGQHGVDDAGDSFYPVPANSVDLHKIQLAWNQFLQFLVYLGPWAKARQGIARFFTCGPTFPSPNFVAPTNRSVDISARFRTNYSRKTIAFQRYLAQQVMLRMNVASEKISRSRYLDELRQSKVAVSPFGWGEPSYKDYEIIINGAALLKPDMSHMSTWPDIYVAGETYLPFRWDCSDLEEVVEDALSGNKWRRIASQAQETYRTHLFARQSQEEFCQRVQQIVSSSPQIAQDRA